jgi:hypothetical protein
MVKMAKLESSLVPLCSGVRLIEISSKLLLHSHIQMRQLMFQAKRRLFPEVNVTYIM